MPNQTTFFLDCFGCFQKIPDFGKVYKIVILLTLIAEETTLFNLIKFSQDLSMGLHLVDQLNTLGSIERSVRTRLSV